MKKNVYSNVFIIIITLLPPLFSIPILTNGLGLSVYGQYMADFSFILLLVVLSDLGFGMFLPKILAQSESLSEKSQIVTSFFAVKILVLPLILFIAFLYFNKTESNYSIFFLFYLAIINFNLTPIMNGLELYSKLVITTVVSKLVFVFCIFYFNFQSDGLFKIIVIQVVTQFIVFIMNFFIVSKIASFNLNIKKTILIIREAFGYYISKLFVNIYQQSSTYIVSMFLSLESVALYSIAIQLYKVGQSFIGAVSRVLLTTIVKSKDFKVLFTYTKITLAIYSLGLIVVLLFSNVILGFFLTLDTQILGTLVEILYISLIFVVFSSYYGYPALSAINKDNYAHIGIFLSSVGYFLSVIFFYLMNHMGLIQLVLCIFFADLIGMLSRLYYAKRFGVFCVNKL